MDVVPVRSAPTVVSPLEIPNTSHVLPEYCIKKLVEDISATRLADDPSIVLPLRLIVRLFVAKEASLSINSTISSAAGEPGRVIVLPAAVVETASLSPELAV